jgi:hypothetical protein
VACAELRCGGSLKKSAFPDASYAPKSSTHENHVEGVPAMWCARSPDRVFPEPRAATSTVLSPLLRSCPAQELPWLSIYRFRWVRRVLSYAQEHARESRTERELQTSLRFKMLRDKHSKRRLALHSCPGPMPPGKHVKPLSIPTSRKYFVPATCSWGSGTVKCMQTQTRFYDQRVVWRPGLSRGRAQLIDLPKHRACREPIRPYPTQHLVLNPLHQHNTRTYNNPSS